MKFAIEVKREEDGRWYAVAEEVNGAMVYGETRANAVAKVVLALRVVADCIRHDDGPMGAFSVVVKAKQESNGQWRAEFQGIPESAASGTTPPNPPQNPARCGPSPSSLRALKSRKSWLNPPPARREDKRA